MITGTTAVEAVPPDKHNSEDFCLGWQLALQFVIEICELRSDNPADIKRFCELGQKIIRP